MLVGGVVMAQDSCYFEVNKYVLYMNKFNVRLETKLVSKVRYKKLEYAKKAYKRIKNEQRFNDTMIELKGYCFWKSQHTETTYKRETFKLNENAKLL